MADEIEVLADEEGDKALEYSLRSAAWVLRDKANQIDRAQQMGRPCPGCGGYDNGACMRNGPTPQ